MGSQDLPSEYPKVPTLSTGTRIVVIASASHLAVIGEAADERGLPGLVIAAHEADEQVARGLFSDASAAVIEVDPNNRGSMQRIGAIRKQHPDLSLIAAIEDASVSLVRTLLREGISDVVALPLDIDELVQVALDVTARHDAAMVSEVRLAPVTVVARSIGGCGATSLATHLAADLAANDQSGRGTVIVDLDIQLGSVADYLGIRPKSHISDLLGEGSRLDEDLIKSVAVQAGEGLWVIAAPESIVPLESIDTDELLRLLTLLRRRYAHVVLDLPTNWTNWALSAVLGADNVLLVVELSVASLRQAKRRLELFDSIGIDKSRVSIIVNRVEKRLFRSINLDDVAQTLDHPVLGSLSLDAPLVSTAQNQGVLVGQLQRKSRFVSDIAEIAKHLRNVRPGESE